MGKLSKYRQSPDPRLVRSVLICNTLKRLEKELEKEGIKINFGPSGVSFFPPVTNTQNMTLDPPPNASQPLTNVVNGVNTVNGSYGNESNYCSPVNEKNDDDETDTERYLLDLDSSSGRVTPFLRSSTECLYEKEATNSELTSTDSSPLSPSLSASSSPLSNSLSPSSSALWNIDENADRLSSLNWSSVLNFSETSSVNSTSTVEKEVIDSSLPAVSAPTSDRLDADTDSSEKSLVTALNGNGSTSLHTLMPPSTHSDTVSSVSHLINHHHLHHHHHHLTNSSCSSSSSPTYSNSSANDEIFGDIDLTLYDFDLISPLSPPNVKLAPVSAEELIQSV
ncbi:hypothetical protein B4U80_06418 [Leptotrombidium deliense]|uniref:SERTA domain-containing protein n=1 Tax=Leptotrombidium deliense TaxID=299467 RepID=A0A443SP18_9ACAR|nr:hypothetical protein B4U80_06418 [Leptotrombidium deliense]